MIIQTVLWIIRGVLTVVKSGSTLRFYSLSLMSLK